MQKRVLVCFLFLSTVLCLQGLAKEFKLVSVHAPNSFIQSVCGDAKWHTMTNPQLYVVVQAGEFSWHSQGQDIGGNKNDFYFQKEKFKIDDNASDIIIKILVGEKERIVRSKRAGGGAIAGGLAGAGVGAVGAGACSGGLGAPAGAAIGFIVGAIVGAGSTQLLPVEGSREVQSFPFYSVYSVSGTHSRDCNSGDILSDGKTIKLVIE